jgi:SAM-dependent methyltransferase
MREDDARLVSQGRELGRLLFTHGLTPDGMLLDIGCGYGRLAIGLIHDNLFHGRYIGFDILERHIEWCRRNLSPAAPGYRFVHLDALNERYNPKGRMRPEELTFPVPAATVDVACAFSVFTHLYRPTIQRYLAEIERCLRPGGTAVTTWLLFDDSRVEAAKGEASEYPMVHSLDEDTLYSDPDDPLRAIAYRESLVRALVAAAGLRVERIEWGTWDGVTTSANFQDLVVIRKPRTARTVSSFVVSRSRALARKGMRRSKAALRPGRS